MSKAHFRRFREWKLTDPEVLQILSGIRRAAANLYVDATEKRVAVHTHLKALGMATNTATALLRAAQKSGLIPWQALTKKPRASHSKKHLTDPAIAAIFANIFHDPKLDRYFEIDANGVAHYCHPRLELRKLMSAPTATRILTEAKKTGLIQVKDLPRELAKAKTQPDDDEEEPKKDHERLKGFSKDRYFLVETSSGFYGLFDRWYGQQHIISRNKKDAVAELARLTKPEPKIPRAPTPSEICEKENPEAVRLQG